MYDEFERDNNHVSQDGKLDDTHHNIQDTQDQTKMEGVSREENAGGSQVNYNGGQPAQNAQGMGTNGQNYAQGNMQNNAQNNGWNQYQSQAQGGGQQYGNSYIPPEPEKKMRKKHTMAGRIAGITAAALLFGTVSGGTMVGVNVLADHLNGDKNPQVGQTTPSAESETERQAPSETDLPVISPAISTDVSSIVEKAMPSVVAINNTMLYERQSWFGPTQTYEVPSSGSGIIVGQNDEELLIVTNNHVVENSKSLEVVFINDKSVKAAVKGTDAENDLAVVAVPLKDIPADTMSQISIAVLGDSDALKVGQGVIAIGNALGYGQSVTVGYVSALNREVKTEDNVAKNLLQTDAAINPGNSGGALLNMKGEVIGINAAKYSSTEVEGMGYAIPISKVQDIIDELMTKKTRVEVAEDKQGYLGIRGQDIDEEMSQGWGMPKGVYITEIIEGSAAANSDLHEKDIITKFDGQGVRGMADLKDLLTYYEAGSSVDLTVQSLQDGQYVERQVTVTLGQRTEEVN